MSVVLLLGGYLSGGWTELIGRRRRGKGEIFWAHKNTYIGLGHTLPTTKQQFLTFIGIFPEIHSIWLASWSRLDRPTIERRFKSTITKITEYTFSYSIFSTCPIYEYAENLSFSSSLSLYTTLLSIMNAKLIQQRFWHRYENGLINTILKILHSLHTCECQVGFP